MDPMNGGGGLTPEQLQAYLEFVSGQGAFDEQDRAVQQQLAMADALRKRNQAAQQHTTGAGAIFGGIGDVINSVAGARGVKQAQAKDAMQQQARIDALRKMAAAQGQPQPDPMQGVPPMLARPPGM